MFVEFEGNKKSSSNPGPRKKQLRILVMGSSDLGSRNTQQDSYLASDARFYSERGILAVLSDGMGGMRDGDRFSGIAVEEMVRYFSEGTPQEDICTELLGAYASAREKAFASCKGDEPDGGATVVAVLVRKNMCAFLSVGDSRIYLMRGGELIQLNREQTLGAVLDESAALGYIPEEEARENLRRASITNHLCETSVKLCDRSITPFKLRSGDKLALMSDGVFGTLSSEEITRCLRKSGAQGVDDIIDAIRLKDKPRQDNCSVLVLAFEDTQNSKAGRDHKHGSST